MRDVCNTAAAFVMGVLADMGAKHFFLRNGERDSAREKKLCQESARFKFNPQITQITQIQKLLTASFGAAQDLLAS